MEPVGFNSFKSYDNSLKKPYYLALYHNHENITV